MSGQALVLSSQDIQGEPGYQIHGVFPSFEACINHISKDTGERPAFLADLIGRSEQKPEQFQLQRRNVLWTAAYTPIRNDSGI